MNVSSETTQTTATNFPAGHCRWVLISPYEDITSHGLRVISSVLKQAGHSVRMIFLPNRSHSLPDFSIPYGDDVLRAVGELCAVADFVGISLMTNYVRRAIEITEAVRNASGARIVWGGIHPTVRPRECLKWADMACIGEGETAVLELSRRFDSAQTLANCPGFLQREDGETVPPLPDLLYDLNQLPHPDYRMEDDYALMSNGSLEKIDAGKMKLLMTEIWTAKLPGHTIYQTMASRGCPMQCTYCCNDFFKSMYRGQSFFRKRIPENIVSEIKEVIHLIPGITFVGFSDDCFFTAPEEEIKRFSDAYKREIGLPFFCLATAPAVTERKVCLLADAGMRSIQMGIESGSDRIKALYKRSVQNEHILKAARIVHDVAKARVGLLYDVIVDCPYETPEDAMDTLDLLQQLPYPYHLFIFSLVLYPGTGLHRKAVEDGKIQDEWKEIYDKQYNLCRITYPNLLFFLARRNAPKKLIAVLAWRPLVRLLAAKPFHLLWQTSIWVLLRLKGTPKPWGFF